MLRGVPGRYSAVVPAKQGTSGAWKYRDQGRHLLYARQLPDYGKEKRNGYYWINLCLVSTLTVSIALFCCLVLLGFTPFSWSEDDTTKDKPLSSASDVCNDHIRRVMGLAVISPFLQSEIEPYWVRRATNMVTEIRDAYVRALQHSSWLSTDFRQAAIKKVRDMVSYVGSPGKHLDPEFVEAFYSQYFQLFLRGQKETLSDELDSANLADLVGIKMAYDAFQYLVSEQRDQNLAGLDMSVQQLFFVNYCLKWCSEDNSAKPPSAPPRSRCMIPLMNMREFSSTFGCSARKPMNPQDKCTFW
ncbi:hypothetical protein MRX96_057592 [Rhipicephalus microplus]